MSKHTRNFNKQIKQSWRNFDQNEKKADRLRIKHQWRALPRRFRPMQFSSDYLHRWNIHEEVANSITHGLGVLLGIAALVLLIIDAVEYGSVYGIVGGAILGVSLIIAYVSSTLYHAVLYPPLKQVFKILDHSSIFILIAGSYTPFCLVTLHGAMGWTIFGIVWGLAIIGITLKIFFVDDFELLSTIVYLLMGWIAVIAIVQLLHHLPLGGIVWLVIGGLCYTFGVLFFVFERVPFFHTIWHLFVLAGSISHFFAVLFYVVPLPV